MDAFHFEVFGFSEWFQKPLALQQVVVAGLLPDPGRETKKNKLGETKYLGNCLSQSRSFQHFSYVPCAPGVFPVA
jgi:hypothetical protein